MIIKRTSRSKSATSSIHYLYYGSYGKHDGKLNQPHHNQNGILKRNATVIGVNCRANNYYHAIHDFDMVLRHKPHNKIKCTNFVLGFSRSDFNFRDQQDVDNACEIARNFTEKAFPNHQAIIALQFDNHRATPHAHICVNELNMNNHKAFRGKSTDIYRLRQIADKTVTAYNRRHFKKIAQLSEWHTYKRQITPIQAKIIERLKSVISDRNITSKTAFRRACKDNGVRASFRRANKRKASKRRHRRSRHERPGLVFKLINKKTGKSESNYTRASLIKPFKPQLSYDGVLNLIHTNKTLIRSEKQRKRHERKQRQIRIRASKSAEASSMASQSASIADISPNTVASASVELDDYSVAESALVENPHNSNAMDTFYNGITNVQSISSNSGLMSLINKRATSLSEEAQYHEKIARQNEHQRIENDIKSIEREGIAMDRRRRKRRKAIREAERKQQALSTKRSWFVKAIYRLRKFGLKLGTKIKAIKEKITARIKPPKPSSQSSFKPHYPDDNDLTP